MKKRYTEEQIIRAIREHVSTHMIDTCHSSERTACTLAGVSRTAFRYQAKPAKDDVLRSRLKELAVQQSAYGYLLLHGILKSEGLVVNKKHTYRLYTEQGLQVRTKKRKSQPPLVSINERSEGRCYGVAVPIQQRSTAQLTELCSTGFLCGKGSLNYGNLIR